MNVFFRRLPLTVKLILIGIIPILFLVYFSVMIYVEKSEKVNLIEDYVDQISETASLGELIARLSAERKASYQYVLKKQTHEKVASERLKTDSLISVLQKSDDLKIADFTKYTFLDELENTRNQVDTSKHFTTYNVIQYYTDAIFRLNTLNTNSPPSNSFAKPIYQDLVTQKILSQMVTFLSIIRTNIYTVLYSKEFMYETLFGTLGVYKVYKSYETEFLLKASPASIRLYNSAKDTTAYKPTVAYIDKLFSTFKFDSTYDSEQWEQVSFEGLKVIRKQQLDLWKSVDTKMKAIYAREKNQKNLTFIFLLFSMLIVILFVAYSINHITALLRELKHAARTISKGGTGFQLDNMPRGVMSNLAKSIMQIDRNNLLLAQAANEIGKGNFDVLVKPRSDEDLLGLSVKKMKHDLREFNAQKDKIQKETEELIHRRDEFFSIASHELKTPVTSLKAYTQLMLMDSFATPDVHRKKMLQKMDHQINKLTALITDLLDTSKVQNGQLIYNKQPFILKQLVMEIIEEVRQSTTQHEIIFNSETEAHIFADRDRIGQVLSNLLLNAIKYAPLSEKIIINLLERDEKIICSVHDFGNGIHEDEHEKIFDRFYRISGNNLHTYPGLGLGLYISKEIIEKHNGKMWLESEKGKGSIFYFELPLN